MVVGSFSLIQPPVDKRHGRNTVGYVFGETTKAVQRSYSADTATFETRQSHLIFSTGRNVSAALYRLLLVASFLMHTQGMSGQHVGKCVTLYGAYFVARSVFCTVIRTLFRCSLRKV